MNSPHSLRVELLCALLELSRLRPEWRLGQTLANLAMTAGRHDPGGVWNLEDDEALAAARTLVEQYSERESRGAASVPRAGQDGRTPRWIGVFESDVPDAAQRHHDYLD
jgi:hypothetical protein